MMLEESDSDMHVFIDDTKKKMREKLCLLGNNAPSTSPALIASGMEEPCRTNLQYPCFWDSIRDFLFFLCIIIIVQPLKGLVKTWFHEILIMEDHNSIQSICKVCERLPARFLIPSYVIILILSIVDKTTACVNN